MTTNIDGLSIRFGDPRQPKALPLSHPKARRRGFEKGLQILKAGTQMRSGALVLPCDILFERDVSVKLRDGTTIFVDIYRPVQDTSSATKCPAILAWSPYGKQGGAGNQVLSDFPFRMGVPQSRLSELQKWEGPDPAFWVLNGYAIVNADARGVGKSEGDIYQWGSQEGRDGADAVDWIGEQEWCNGKVGMSGNSWLAIVQWFIAAERPRHLSCIAPWEGFADLYREGLLGAGVIAKPSLDFTLKLLSVNAGENSWENTVAMGLDHSFGAYHDDKRARVERIEVPAYVVGSWTNPIHSYGTFRAYAMLQTKKWLRVHDSWEWPDYYEPENVQDLLKFFDYFLKDKQNGWDDTKKARMSIIDTANSLPISGQILNASSFPPQNLSPLKLYFDGQDSTLSRNPSTKLTEIAYDIKDGIVSFTTEPFIEDSLVLCGTIELSLSVSMNETHDSDIFVNIEKILRPSIFNPLNTPGTHLKVPYQYSFQTILIRAAHHLGLTNDTSVLFYTGPEGRIRISKRIQDEKLNVKGLPVQKLEVENFVHNGEKVTVPVPMAPVGMKINKGERLRVKVGGVDTHTFPPVDGADLDGIGDLKSLNDGAKGKLTIHCGGHDGGNSYLILPVVQGLES